MRLLPWRRAKRFDDAPALWTDERVSHALFLINGPGQQHQRLIELGRYPAIAAGVALVSALGALGPVSSKPELFKVLATLAEGFEATLAYTIASVVLGEITLFARQKLEWSLKQTGFSKPSYQAWDDLRWLYWMWVITLSIGVGSFVAVISRATNSLPNVAAHLH